MRRKSLWHSLGEFVGHIRAGLKSDISSRKVVRREVQEQDQGNIVLRRTVIEEVEIKRDDQPGKDRPADGDHSPGTP